MPSQHPYHMRGAESRYCDASHREQHEEDLHGLVPICLRVCLTYFPAGNCARRLASPDFNGLLGFQMPLASARSYELCICIVAATVAPLLTVARRPHLMLERLSEPSYLLEKRATKTRSPAVGNEWLAMQACLLGHLSIARARPCPFEL